MKIKMILAAACLITASVGVLATKASEKRVARWYQVPASGSNPAQCLPAPEICQVLGATPCTYQPVPAGPIYNVFQLKQNDATCLNRIFYQQ